MTIDQIKFILAKEDAYTEFPKVGYKKDHFNVKDKMFIKKVLSEAGVNDLQVHIPDDKRKNAYIIVDGTKYYISHYDDVITYRLIKPWRIFIKQFKKTWKFDKGWPFYRTPNSPGYLLEVGQEETIWLPEHLFFERSLTGKQSVLEPYVKFKLS